MNADQIRMSSLLPSFQPFQRLVTEPSMPGRPVRALAVAALTAVALLMPAPAAVAQYDPRYDDPPRPGAQSPGDRGFLGGLFGRGEQDRRAPRHGDHDGRQSGMPASELIVRLERVENQLRQLTGTLEQLEFRNRQLEQHLRRMQEDVEARFEEAAPGRSGAAPRRSPSPRAEAARPEPTRPEPTRPEAARPESPPPSAPQRRADVFDPATDPQAPGVPRTLGSLPADASAEMRPGDGPPPVVMEEPTVGATGGRAPGAPLDLATLAERIAMGEEPTGAPPPREREPRTIVGALPSPPPRNPNSTGVGLQPVAAPSATPRDELALAQGYVQRRDYALAEQSLRAFLQKYPSDGLAADAHFWLGESLFQQQRYRDAAESFLTISTKFEKSGRAPDSLLRLGQSLAALGEREAACATLQEVVRKYPRVASGTRQTVEREQKRVRC